MAHDTLTSSTALPPRRWTYPYVITLSDANADANLQRDGRAYGWIQNVGTAGKVNIVWSNGTTVDIYLATGQEFEGGLWVHAKSTGTSTGVDLRGLVRVEGGR